MSEETDKREQQIITLSEDLLTALDKNIKAWKGKLTPATELKILAGALMTLVCNFAMAQGVERPPKEAIYTLFEFLNHVYGYKTTLDTPDYIG